VLEVRLSSSLRGVQAVAQEKVEPVTSPGRCQWKESVTTSSVEDPARPGSGLSSTRPP